ncbi:PspC domain-containing protein [Aliikangiella sp. G2MR2-5]|uniref:PspC domain-containing protein n=1 Tax=Aliikangiella sp. G2MR2-5 TaxID=2788943 RepID=UPI0018AC1A59|nr:PspC domain-containing protein [Aliikangiella sp. G2MR2-5]
MSRYSHYRDREEFGYRHSQFRKPRARKKIMGVCAGLAQQFDWDVTLVRVVAVLLLITFGLPVFVGYLIAGALFY